MGAASRGFDEAGSSARLEVPFLAAIHDGMTRGDLYRASRRIGVKPSNPEYVKWVGGKLVSDGKFPMPDATHPNPDVVVFFFKAAQGCAIPTDKVHIFFDGRDRVTKWYTRTQTTGGCP
jgi:hypothetical protein